MEFQTRSVPDAVSYEGSGDGLPGEYFNAAGELFVSRLDAVVDFDWGQNGPVAGADRDHFRVRWTGWLQPRFTGTYRLHMVSDDGARLWIGGRLIIDDWAYSQAVKASERIELQAGQFYPIQLLYFESEREAVARLLWSSPDTPLEVIPADKVPGTSTPLYIERGFTKSAKGDHDDAIADYLSPSNSNRNPPSHTATVVGLIAGNATTTAHGPM